MREILLIAFFGGILFGELGYAAQSGINYRRLAKEGVQQADKGKLIRSSRFGLLGALLLYLAAILFLAKFVTNNFEMAFFVGFFINALIASVLLKASLTGYSILREC